jgi:hypothetical protein
MVNIILVQLLVLVFSFSLFAKVDRIHTESYLGEKNLTSYAERYQPLVVQDIYQGKLTFADEIFFQNFFEPYLFQKETDYTQFFRSELKSGVLCSNELLAQHFDDIRYAYRLITLSYLLESQWHMKLTSDHLRLKKGCEFDLKTWVKSCRPKTSEMKKFVGRLSQYLPRYDESLPAAYTKGQWLKEFTQNNYKWYSQYRLKTDCQGKCTEENLAKKFNQSCEADQSIMTQICSEADEIYGLSTNRDAYFLLGLSNIINTFNRSGEAVGCLRRFSEVMAHKEVRYDVLNKLFPSLQTFLRQKYQERFLQGRVFFFGSGKEFEEKGLSELYVKDQPLVIEKEPVVVAVKPTPVPKIEAPIVPVKIAEVKEFAAEPKVVPPKEIKKQLKSAFILAAEFRKFENLDRAEVDMLKLRYDYIFSLNMINTLSERLKTFMTREALVEMMNYDKLGTKEGPVPLLFLKYMIDMQEHQGLWNLVSVVGERFYVSNEIDAAFRPAPELVQLTNNESTGKQWQLYILRP